VRSCALTARPTRTRGKLRATFNHRARAPVGVNVKAQGHMNGQLFLPLLITIVVAVGGWVAGHRLNVARDREAKHRELRLRYLLDAYRALENFAGWEPPFDKRHVEDLEKAVADIQLFGSQTQSDQLSRVFTEKAVQGESDLNVVINELRTALRKELDLPALQGNVTWLRIDRARVSRAP